MKNYTMISIISITAIILCSGVKCISSDSIKINLERNCNISEVQKKITCENINISADKAITIKSSEKYMDSDFNIEFRNSKISMLAEEIFMMFSNSTEFKLTGSQMELIDEISFSAAKNLKVICLDHNLIEYIPNFTFKRAPFLTKIILSSNKIHKLEPYSFSGLKLLKLLDLSQNPIIYLPDKVLTSLPPIAVVNLDHTEIKDIHFDEDLHCSITLKYVPITNFQSQSIKSLTIFGALLKYVKIDGEILNLTIIGRALKSMDISYPSSLESLSLAPSKIFNYNSLIDINNLEELKLDILNTDFLSEEYFGHLSNLKYLQLKIDDSNNFHFSNLSPVTGTLEILDLSDSKLNSITPANQNDFPEMHKLKKLFISNTGINNFDRHFLFTKFPKLEVIDVVGNTFNCSTLYGIRDYLGQTGFIGSIKMYATNLTNNNYFICQAELDTIGVS